MCGNPDCVNLVRGQPYCEAHAQSWVHGTGGGVKRTGAYRRLRSKILKRDQYRCQLNYSDICTRRATEVDHVIPAVRGGDDDEGNLRAVCVPCHRRKTSYEGHSERTR